jgi:hypothetical protein
MEDQVLTQASPDQKLVVDDRRPDPRNSPSHWPLRAALIAAALGVGLYLWYRSPGKPHPLAAAAASTQAVIIRAAEAHVGDMGM